MPDDYLTMVVNDLTDVDLSSAVCAIFTKEGGRAHTERPSKQPRLS